jgi:hypothetical protein
MRQLSGLMRGAINLIMAGFIALVGAGAAAEVAHGRYVAPLIAVALLCGAAGAGLLALARKREQGKS